MSESPAPKGGPESQRPTGGETGPAHAIDGRDYDLHSVVVAHDGEPDRCTIYPRRDRCLDRMAAWLSADRDAFVGLEEMR